MRVHFRKGRNPCLFCSQGVWHMVRAHSNSWPCETQGLISCACAGAKTRSPEAVSSPSPLFPPSLPSSLTHPVVFVVSGFLNTLAFTLLFPPAPGSSLLLLVRSAVHYIFFLSFFVFLPFLGLLPRHMEGPRLGGLIGSYSCLRHSHNHSRSEPCL